jgi:hypothetical protein
MAAEQCTVLTGLSDAVARAFRFLDAMIMADGRLPLLKDTTYGVDPHAVLSEGAEFLGNAWRPGCGHDVSASPAGAATPSPPRSTERLADRRCRRAVPRLPPAHSPRRHDRSSFASTAAASPSIPACTRYEPEWRDHFPFHGRAQHRRSGRGESERGLVELPSRGAARGPLNVQFHQKGVAAEHDGYERLPVPVRHRRTVTLFGGASSP